MILSKRQLSTVQDTDKRVVDQITKVEVVVGYIGVGMHASARIKDTGMLTQKDE